MAEPPGWRGPKQAVLPTRERGGVFHWDGIQSFSKVEFVVDWVSREKDVSEHQDGHVKIKQEPNGAAKQVGRTQNFNIHESLV
ncbi:MAG: hypothetical protein ACFFCW_22675 [Candidatus Hodarchaeota archaeon]